ncbi:putative carbonic anhydrase 3 [Zeugodacus cucurbitae]|uniref:Putative carbonic anhydrase 3 n=1 Tax=Zeugodacus cucurbitae TaxID=28588 RepID=A0A0A1WJU5_ZEUCU|nr:putative carbonic anhydrase 3 [Zeugodacus cucurbitae]
MVECSLCSLLNFLFNCIYHVISCALEYPLVVMALSFLIALVFVTNIYTAKLICDFRCPGRGASAGGGSCGTAAGGGGGEYNSSMNFDYGPDNGPHNWRCSDANQSPINIIEENVQKFPIRELLCWNHYDDLPNGIMLENNGHTVVLRACFSGNTPTVSGADLLACYTFVELCFRWSLLSNDGSEHMLNYRKFPLELQAMHRTGPTGDCTSSYDLLMVGYFFEVSANNPYLDPLVQNLHRIQKPGSKIEIPPFPLSYLLYQFRTGFYSYGGSLTEPPCYQGAEWFLFPEPLAISERQLSEFRQLLSKDGKTRILRNSRPVQNINCTRVVNLNQYNPIEACQMEPPVSEVQCEDEESFE